MSSGIKAIAGLRIQDSGVRIRNSALGSLLAIWLLNFLSPEFYDELQTAPVAKAEALSLRR